jgi:hypothetical protein
MTGYLLKEVNSYRNFYDRTRKRQPFNTGDCMDRFDYVEGRVLSSIGWMTWKKIFILGLESITAKKQQQKNVSVHFFSSFHQIS